MRCWSVLSCALHLLNSGCIDEAGDAAASKTETTGHGAPDRAWDFDTAVCFDEFWVSCAVVLYCCPVLLSCAVSCAAGVSLRLENTRCERRCVFQQGGCRNFRLKQIPSSQTFPHPDA